MLLKSKSTYLGLDLSINGTGIAVVSNDPRFKSLGPVTKLSNSKFSLISASFIKGERKDDKTFYSQKSWSKDGIVSSPKLEGKPLYLRAHTIFHEFIEPQLIHNPSMIIIEGFSYGSTKGLVFDIAEFTGQIKYLIELTYLERGLKAPIFIVPPTNLKVYTTGKGQCSKDLMLEATKKRYQIDLLNDNICDSFALAMMGAELGAKLEGFVKKDAFEDLKEIRRKLAG